MAKQAVQADNDASPLTNGPAEDDVVAVNLGKLSRAKDVFESANGAYRNVVKHVEGKLNLKAAKRALAIAKSDDRDEYVEELRATLSYLYILGVPLTKKQLDLFRVEEPRVPDVDKATTKGRYAGVMGEGSETCPYSPGSEQREAWLAAWHEGGKQRELILALEPAPGSELITGAEDPGFEDEAA